MQNLETFAIPYAYGNSIFINTVIRALIKQPIESLKQFEIRDIELDEENFESAIRIIKVIKNQRNPEPDEIGIDNLDKLIRSIDIVISVKISGKDYKLDDLLLIIDYLKGIKNVYLEITNLKFEVQDLVKIIKKIASSFTLKYSLPSDSRVFAIHSKYIPRNTNSKDLEEIIKNSCWPPCELVK